MTELMKFARHTRPPAKRSHIILRSRFVRRAVSIVLLAGGVILCPGEHTNVCAQGQPSSQKPSDGLTLSVAMDIALRSNPLIKATSSGRELADAQLDEARAGRFPLLQLGQSFTTSNNPVFVFGSLLEQSRFGPQNFDSQFLNNPG